jgi:ribosomal-protein-alanine N-acetyltransferase
MNIRAFNDDDVAAIYATQLMCPQAAQWRVEDYRRLADDPCGMVLTAEMESANSPAVVGFAAFHRVADQAELRNLAVAPQHQRQGIARALLRHGIGKLGETGVRRIFLEVRSSNCAALELYASLGFRLLSARKDYYQNPLEEALVMALDIIPPWGNHGLAKRA